MLNSKATFQKLNSIWQCKRCWNFANFCSVRYVLSFHGVSCWCFLLHPHHQVQGLQLALPNDVERHLYPKCPTSWLMLSRCAYLKPGRAQCSWGNSPVLGHQKGMAISLTNNKNCSLNEWLPCCAWYLGKRWGSMPELQLKSGEGKNSSRRRTFPTLLSLPLPTQSFFTCPHHHNRSKGRGS